MNAYDYAAGDLVLRATLILALPWAIGLLRRHASAAERHLLWTLALAALILLPVCRIGLPAWRLGVLPADSPPAPAVLVPPTASDRAPDAFRKQSAYSQSQVPAPRHGDAAATPSSDAALASAAPRHISIFSCVWIAGACFSLTLVAIRHLLLAKRARHWTELTDSAIIACTRQAAKQLRVGMPRILAAEAHTLPIVWCWRRPTIVLPATASAWPRDQLCAVLLHELAHIKRRDCLTQLIGQIASALYWFHPLAWFGLAQTIRERERACDDLVLNAGVRPSDYTTTLVAVAREYRQNRILEPALPVARPSRLRERIQAILDTRRRYARSQSRLSAFVLGLAIASCGLIAAVIQPVARAIEQVASNDQPSGSSNGPKAERQITVTVRDTSGKPIPGATVYLSAPVETQLYHMEPAVFHELTNDRGEATLQASFDINAVIIAASRYEIPPLRLIARAPGKGLAALPLHLDQTAATLDLPAEVPIEGTLKAPDGGPARHVRVCVASIKYGPSDWLNYYSASHTPEFMPQDVMTDADGQFTIHGMPAGGEALLRIFSDDCARLDFYVSTQAKQIEEHKGSAVKTVPPRFTLPLQPARIFEGTITAKDTGKPLAGVVVNPWAASMSVVTDGRTDADGHYKIGSYQSTPTDFSNHAYAVTIHPAASSGYLGLYWKLPRWPDGSKTVVKRDFALARGRLIEGRITEEGGSPVAGASVTYEPKPGNKFFKYTRDLQYDLSYSTLTDADGRFAVTGLPGPGFVIAKISGPFARVKLPVSETSGNSDVFPQGYAKIDMPETGSVPPVQITFKRGLILEARALQPDGKRVPYVMALCREQDESYGLGRQNRGRRFEAGLFQLANCEPGKKYHVLFLQPELNLGAVADLVADPKQTDPIEVKLQRTASLSGRVVHEDGTPAGDVQAYTEVSLMAGAATIPPWDQIRGVDQWAIYTSLFGQHYFAQLQHEERTNDKGEFRLTRMVPGASTYLTAAGKNFHGARVAVTPLSPGESRDMGTLVLKKYKPGK